MTSPRADDALARSSVATLPVASSLEARLLIARSEALLAGLTGCGPDRARASLRAVADDLGSSVVAVAQLFARYAGDSPDALASALVARVLEVAKSPTPAQPRLARRPRADAPAASVVDPGEAARAEAARVAAVRRYAILDTPPDGAFDRITALAARLIGVPISIISIVDTDRIWFKSHHGLDAEQVGREPGLCASAILHDEPWIVQDAGVDARTLANPLVAGELGLRFYAGVPLTTHDGHNLGTLCVIDRAPRTLAGHELATLTDLAALVMDELEMRLAARDTAAATEHVRAGAEDVARTLQAGLLPLQLPTVVGMSVAARYHVANYEQVGGDFYDVVATSDECWFIVGDVCGKGSGAAVLTSTARWTLRTLISGAESSPAAALERLNQVWAEGYDDPQKYCTVALARLRHADVGARATISLAGIPHPLLVRDGHVHRLGATGAAIGWLPDGGFSDFEVTLASGDVLLVFTDGLIEALRHRGVDDQRVQTVLRPHAGGTAEQIADAFDAELTERLRDDAAFLVVRVD